MVTKLDFSSYNALAGGVQYAAVVGRVPQVDGCACWGCCGLTNEWLQGFAVGLQGRRGVGLLRVADMLLEFAGVFLSRPQHLKSKRCAGVVQATVAICTYASWLP